MEINMHGIVDLSSLFIVELGKRFDEGSFSHPMPMSGYACLHLSPNRFHTHPSPAEAGLPLGEL